MALLYSEEEPKELANKERKEKAFLHLVLTLLIIYTLAVIGYLVLVYVFGWEGMGPPHTSACGIDVHRVPRGEAEDWG